MITQKVVSPIKDDKINSHLNESKIWTDAYHFDELTSDVRKKHPVWFIYTIKFDGPKPIHCTKIDTL